MPFFLNKRSRIEFSYIYNYNYKLFNIVNRITFHYLYYCKINFFTTMLYIVCVQMQNTMYTLE